MRGTDFIGVCGKETAINSKSTKEAHPFLHIEGILSLYEASFCLMKNGTILEEAKNFSSKHLKEFMRKCGDTDLSLLHGHALEIPLHWRMPRLETHWFIDFYERKHSMNQSLLKLAKLDFNMVQAIHQEDLKHASR
ncbi:hypothetical protein L6164_023786 [Bauhinia variegata]|uniref:Uncharacterized protein n=1 Tax=Bauhinia variegata TaxID=167791 RepID=A0ACB9MJL3_BAUVA|nr:hypothetical protein L6164_023786 [Bauhinia variegata]